jgi:hypothetical protein
LSVPWRDLDVVLVYEELALIRDLLPRLAFLDERLLKREILLVLLNHARGLTLCALDEVRELGPLEEKHNLGCVDEADRQFEVEPHTDSVAVNVFVAVNQ